MPLLDTLERYLSTKNRLSRRKTIGRLVKGSFALLAAIGGVTPFQQALAACNCQPHAEGCCDLCFFNGCPNAGSCPGGEAAYIWICQQRIGSHTCSFTCGECYSSCCSFSEALCGGGCPCIHGAPSAESLLQVLPVRAKGEACH